MKTTHSSSFFPAKVGGRVERERGEIFPGIRTTPRGLPRGPFSPLAALKGVAFLPGRPRGRAAALAVVGPGPRARGRGVHLLGAPQPLGRLEPLPTLHRTGLRLRVRGLGSAAEDEEEDEERKEEPAAEEAPRGDDDGGGAPRWPQPQASEAVWLGRPPEEEEEEREDPPRWPQPQAFEAVWRRPTTTTTGIGREATLKYFFISPPTPHPHSPLEPPPPLSRSPRPVRPGGPPLERGTGSRALPAGGRAPIRATWRVSTRTPSPTCSFCKSSACTTT